MVGGSSGSGEFDEDPEDVFSVGRPAYTVPEKGVAHACGEPGFEGPPELDGKGGLFVFVGFRSHYQEGR